MEWISVETRLPNDGDHVLVSYTLYPANKPCNIKTEGLISSAFYAENYWRMDNDCCNQLDDDVVDVLYWMLLPSAPNK